MGVGRAAIQILNARRPPWSILAPLARRARFARPVQIHGHRRIEATRNRFSRSTFGLKLSRKAARGVRLGGSAAAIHGHPQERRDLFALGHTLSLGGRAARSIRSNGLIWFAAPISRDKSGD